VNSTKCFTASVTIWFGAFGLACGPESSEPRGSAPGQEVESVQSAITNFDRAFHWAPIHYQDVNEAGGTGVWGYADMISRFDDDGDWIGWNNWDHLDGENMAYAYYSVAETDTHWFLGYAFFHPRDWAAGVAQEHENDMEGVMAAVRKDGSTWGAFEAAMTIWHEHWFIYRNPAAGGYLGPGRLAPFGIIENLVFETSGQLSETHVRPMTSQQAEGHGLTGCANQNNCGLTGNDSVRYAPHTSIVESPLLPIEGVVTRRYKLIDMAAADGLWGHRFDHNAQASWKTYWGGDSSGCGEWWSTCADNAAGTPWGWSNYELLLFADPAKVFNEYISGWDNMNPNRALSLAYTGNTLGTPHSWRSTWTPVAEGGQTDKSVAAAVLDGRMYVLAKGVGSGAQQVNVSSSGGADWTPFSAVPGIMVPSGSLVTDSQPASVTCNEKLYMVVKLGTGEQSLRWNVKTQTGSPATGWGFWLPVPGATTNTGVGLACRANKVYVFLKGGGDNRIYFAYIDTWTSAWSSWNEVPSSGLTYKTPAAAFDETTLDLDVVVVGTDNKPWINRLCSTCGELGWTGWSQHPGWTTTHSPVALAWDWNAGSGVPSGIYMVARNADDNRIDADAWASGSWRGPSIVRGHQHTPDAPTLVRFNGVLHLLVRGMTDQRIWMTAGEGPSLLLSAGRQTDQISTYASAGPGLAIDGRTDSAADSWLDGHISGNYFAGFTTHTEFASNPWWEVDLGASRIFSAVNVWNRTDCCANRLRDWSVLTSNDHTNWTTIFTDSRPQGAGQLTVLNQFSELYNGSNAGKITSAVAWVGRWVRIQINRPESLHLGEVEVLAY
jgi:hypothetical protein